MNLSSPSFPPHGKIPSKYTCDGENINPPLKIEHVPANSQSLVLIMDDPDIPDFAKKNYGIDVWDHWVIFNIPPTTTEIPEGKILLEFWEKTPVEITPTEALVLPIKNIAISSNYMR